MWSYVADSAHLWGIYSRQWKVPGEGEEACVWVCCGVLPDWHRGLTMSRTRIQWHHLILTAEHPSRRLFLLPAVTRDRIPMVFHGVSWCFCHCYLRARRLFTSTRSQRTFATAAHPTLCFIHATEYDRLFSQSSFTMFESSS